MKIILKEKIVVFGKEYKVVSCKPAPCSDCVFYDSKIKLSGCTAAVRNAPKELNCHHVDVIYKEDNYFGKKIELFK